MGVGGAEGCVDPPAKCFRADPAAPALQTAGYMFPLAATELAYHNRHHADTKPTYLLAVEGLAYHNMGRIGVQLPASSSSSSSMGRLFGLLLL